MTATTAEDKVQDKIAPESTRADATSKAKDVRARRDREVARGVSTYAPSIIADHAHGAELWDVDGRRYIDFAGGIGVLNVGHTPPSVVGAIKRQSEKLIHTCFSVAFYETYIDLCERLNTLTPGDFQKKSVLFNSGAEAVENSIKIARTATGRKSVIAFTNAFHGRTLMAMSLTGKDRPYREGFGPFAPNVHHASFPYSYRCDCPTHDESCEIESGADLEKLLDEVGPRNVAAIIVEPVQGEGGFIVAPAGWLQKVRAICDREGILLLSDEIQSGYGRTGRMFAIEHGGVVPDLVLVAKSMAAGLPLSAVIGRAEIMDGPQVGGIGGTFGGNPLSCAAGLAVLDLFEEQGLVERAREIGRIVAERFTEMACRLDPIGEVRGLGAMQAMELVFDRDSKAPAAELTSSIIHECHDRGLLIIKAGFYDNVIRFLAPLVISDELLGEGLDILRETVARNA